MYMRGDHMGFFDSMSNSSKVIDNEINEIKKKYIENSYSVDELERVILESNSIKERSAAEMLLKEKGYHEGRIKEIYANRQH